MTQYTIYATAANSVGNIVTVNSVGNMFLGLPIVFSGNTFGNITAGATYYIGTVIPGYPTSTITLSSLPGGAVYAVGNATGNMTAVFSSGGQQIINTVPPGESLTDAFTAVNVNFDQLFAAGPVNSNIQIANNTILTTNTNGNINLVPNGVGTVVVNGGLLPDRANVRNLGSNINRFSTIYAQYLNVGNLAYTANTINANLIGSVYATSGGPVIVNADTNTVTANTISSSGNVTGNYILGNIAFASGTPATYGNANVANYLPTFSGNLTAGNISAAGNISGTYFFGDGRYISNITVAGGTKIVNGNSWANVQTANGNMVINTNGSEWTFGTDGSLTLPQGVTLGDYPNAGPRANTAALSGTLVYLSSTDGNAWVGVEDGTPSIGSTPTTIWSFGANGNLTAPGNISTTGNITGSYILGNIAFANGIPATYGNANVANYLPTFSGNLTAGNISTTGNITTSGNFVGNGATLSNVATQFKSAWTVTAGTANYSFQVPANDTYQLWVRGNIPSGIIVYTATAALSNTNVPVLGVQYGWNYIAGGNLILNSLPSQFVGTAGAISNAAPTVTNTDVFTFNITNNSGVSQTVYYGWTKIS